METHTFLFLSMFLSCSIILWDIRINFHIWNVLIRFIVWILQSLHMNNYLNTACIHPCYISHANLLCRWLVGRFTAKTEKARADEAEWKRRGQQRPLRKSSGREGARGSCPHAKEAKVLRLLLFSFLVLEFSFQRKFKFLFLASLKIAMKIYFQYVLKFFFYNNLCVDVILWTRDGIFL